MINRFSLGRYLFTLFIVLIGFLYALPNIYGDSPALQIKGKVDTLKKVQVVVTPAVKDQILKALEQGSLMEGGAVKNPEKQAAITTPSRVIYKNNDDLVLSFANINEQSAAKKVVENLLLVDGKALTSEYVVAQTLQTKTPSWLLTIGAEPMKHGLDLQGGVHFLMAVDVNSAIDQQVDSEASPITESLLTAVGSKNKYQDFASSPHVCWVSQGSTCPTGPVVPEQTPDVPAKYMLIPASVFKNQDGLSFTLNFLYSKYPNFDWKQIPNTMMIQGRLKPAYFDSQRQTIMSQVIDNLGNRVNQLGVSDATVEQQGTDRVGIDLPGIQDAAQASDILNQTASLAFYIVPKDQSLLKNAVPGQPLPPNVFLDQDGAPIVLSDKSVLTGNQISGAVAGQGQNGGPVININLSGDISKFIDATTDAWQNHQSMATVFVESIPTVTTVDGQPHVKYEKKQVVINVARVMGALGSQFEIEGLSSPAAANNLALLLRAGSLTAPIAPIAQEVIGPSLGKHNIELGIQSIAVGFIAIVIFMAFYYSVFGLIANLALFVNLCLQLAVLSILGATLTLPGIAGIVLTIGMAVDANVLIYERIREELRLGTSIQGSLHAGFEKAFATIVDANVTTLIVAGVLFWMGAGAVKGFAVTLTVGILTSMFTAIMVTRALVNLSYGRPGIKKLHIGMRKKI
jgi:preprotein translocase subunit SecD